MSKQAFGGDWTEDKLIRVRKYLAAYATIMKNHNFRYAYIDAFTGTGYHTLKDTEEPDTLMLPEFIEQEPQRFMDGSARMLFR